MIQQNVGSVKNTLSADAPTGCWHPFAMERHEKQVASAARKPFADALKSIRIHYGLQTGQGDLGQEAFAKMLGIEGDRPGERYGHYERATREPPIWLLAAIRRVTGFSLDYLIAALPPGRPIPRRDVAVDTGPVKHQTRTPNSRTEYRPSKHLPHSRRTLG